MRNDVGGGVKGFNNEDAPISCLEEPLDSRQLKAFVILSKNGSYTETARELCLTPSAIIHSMRALESVVGCRLLGRLDNKIALTEAGEALLRHAERALEDMHQARLTLKALNQWGFRRMRLGLEDGTYRFFLAGVLVKLHKEFPHLLLNLELLKAGEAQTWVETNRADLVLSEKPDRDGRTDFVPLFTDHFRIIVNPAHPWAIRGGVPRSDLAKQPYVRLCASPQTKRMIDDFLSRDGIVLNTRVEMEAVEAIVDFLGRTLCFSVLPTWMVSQELIKRNLVAFPLGRRALDQTWGVLHRHNRPLNLAESTFLRLCRDNMSAISSESAEVLAVPS